MDQSRMNLAREMLSATIADATSIVIYYAELTEAEKFSKVVRANMSGYGTILKEFNTTSPGDRCHIEHMTIVVDVDSLCQDINQFEFSIEFGNPRELYFIEQVTLEDLLPGRGLNIAISDVYCQRILDGSRAGYLEEMNRLMSEV
jgi:hypothetical protein